MADSRLRRHIARDAAKLMYERVESEYFTAKRKAAARLGINFKYQPQQLPSNREIRDEIQTLARIYEGEKRFHDLRDMRQAGLRMMRRLESFEPRLIGSVVTGHVRRGSDIDIHIFSDSVSPVCETLDRHGLSHHVERKRIIKHNEERVFTHIHARERFDFELTMYPRELVGYRFKSSITGKSIVRVSVAGLEELIAQAHPDAEIPSDTPETIDRFLLWSALLKALETVKQDPRWHPEGDALYHSLQAFELAREEFAYDQEMVTATLLHDLGKAIDSGDHAAAALEALDGTLTPREAFLIGHHMDALDIQRGCIGRKLKRRLEASEWFEDLMILRDIDDRARRRGVDVCNIDDAIEFLRDMDTQQWQAIS